MYIKGHPTNNFQSIFSLIPGKNTETYKMVQKLTSASADISNGWYEKNKGTKCFAHCSRTAKTTHHTLAKNTVPTRNSIACCLTWLSRVTIEFFPEIPPLPQKSLVSKVCTLGNVFPAALVTKLFPKET